MSYTHLAREERYQIYALRKAGFGVVEIAEQVSRSPSTISRELRRNCGQKGYRPKQAEETAQARRAESCRHPRITDSQWRGVEKLLEGGWSPEQISGRGRREKSLSISPEWIYQYVYANKALGGCLWRFLRGRKRNRRRYGSGRSRRGQIPGRVGIEHRPAEADNRTRVGHWEGDTLYGGRSGVVTLVERRSRFTRIGKTLRRTAAATRHAMNRRLASLGRRVLSVTVDNGREFLDHAGIAEDLDAPVYFAAPYAAWQRGTNENTNGLIRQYLPKSRDLSDLTGPEIRKIENRLNHRPRRTLDFRTPHEVMYNERHNLTVALRS